MEEISNLDCQEPSISLADSPIAKLTSGKNVSENGKANDDEVPLGRAVSQLTKCPIILPLAPSEAEKVLTPDKHSEQQMPMTYCFKPQGKRQLILPSSPEAACAPEAATGESEADDRACKVQKHDSSADGNVLQDEEGLSDQSSRFFSTRWPSPLSENEQEWRNGAKADDTHTAALPKGSSCPAGLGGGLNFETLLSLPPSTVGCTLLSFLTPTEAASVAVASPAGAALLRSMLSNSESEYFQSLCATLGASSTASIVGDDNDADRAPPDEGEAAFEEKRKAVGEDDVDTQNAYDIALAKIGDIFGSAAMRLAPVSVPTFLRNCIHLLQPLAADELMQTLGNVVRRSVKEWTAADMGELVWAFFSEYLSPAGSDANSATAGTTGIAFRAFCRASGLSTGLFECSCLDVLEAIALQCAAESDEMTVHEQSAKLAFVAAFLQPSEALTPETVVCMCAEFLSSEEVEHIATGFGRFPEGAD